jgi:adenosylcobinamide-GDP ribazoletransferase
MLAAPLVGVLLAIPCVALLWLLITRLEVSALLVAALVIALVAVLNRGLHLDGLADTADGLGSGTRGERALDIMSKSDIGPFGVVTLVLVLLIQVASLASVLTSSDGTGGSTGLAMCALVTALVSSRTTLTVNCRRGVRAARPGGLGATVAESVPPIGAMFITAFAVASGATFGWLIGGPRAALVQTIAALAALGATWWVTRRCVQRFGGITGDVLGCGVETAMTVSLVVTGLFAPAAISALMP